MISLKLWLLFSLFVAGFTWCKDFRTKSVEIILRNYKYSWSSVFLSIPTCQETCYFAFCKSNYTRTNTDTTFVSAFDAHPLGNDVELNPGPMTSAEELEHSSIGINNSRKLVHKSLRCLYWNTRSLFSSRN